MPYLPVVGQNMSSPDFPVVEFRECPAYFLRTVRSDLPAEHLIDDGTHPATLIGEWAFEVESGSRNVDTLSPKARDLVHLYLGERGARERKLSEMRSERHGK